jgi:hypothetical protein
MTPGEDTTVSIVVRGIATSIPELVIHPQVGGDGYVVSHRDIGMNLGFVCPNIREAQAVVDHLHDIDWTTPRGDAITKAAVAQAVSHARKFSTQSKEQHQ